MSTPSRTFWLLELPTHPGRSYPLWWMGGGDWTRDVHKAAKFPSKASAERRLAQRIALALPNDTIVTEHQFVDWTDYDAPTQRPT
jgi:hypothetical protein